MEEPRNRLVHAARRSRPGLWDLVTTAVAALATPFVETLHGASSVNWGLAAAVGVLGGVGAWTVRFLWNLWNAPAEIATEHRRAVDAAYERAIRDRDESQAKLATITGSTANLEVRFSQDTPYRYTGDQRYVHYRIGIHNYGPAGAQNLKVLLLSIEPAPKAGTFNADFPYRLREANNMDSSLSETLMEVNAPGSLLNPTGDALMEMICYWMSGEAPPNLYVSGIDTKAGHMYRHFKMIDGESWTLTYEISCENAPHLVTRFSATRAGDLLTVERLD